MATTSERLFFFISFLLSFCFTNRFGPGSKKAFFVEERSHSCTVTAPPVISAQWKILQTNTKMESLFIFLLLDRLSMKQTMTMKDNEIKGFDLACVCVCACVHACVGGGPKCQTGRQRECGPTGNVAVHTWNVAQTLAQCRALK